MSQPPTHQNKCTCHSCISPPKTPFISPLTLLANLPLDNNSSYPYKHTLFTLPFITPSSQTASLQTLPTELYGEILSYLTIQEITDLRRVSQYTRFAIDGVLQYQEIFTFAPSVIRACLATKTAERITLRDVYYALTNAGCMVCGGEGLGTNLCLWTGERVCVWCLRNDVTLQPVEMGKVLKMACNMRSKIRGLLPLKNTLKVVPGSYMVRGKNSACVTKAVRKALFLERDVEKGKLSLLTDVERKVVFGNQESFEAEKRRVVQHNPFVADHIEANIYPVNPNGAPPGHLDPMRDDMWEGKELLYMTSIFIPYLHPKTKEMDHGVVCEECMLHMRYREFKQLGRGVWTNASDRKRALINEARRKSCVFYLREELEKHVKEEHEGVELSEEEAAHRTQMLMRKKNDIKTGGDGDLAELKSLGVRW